MADGYEFRGAGSRWLPGLPRVAYGREGYLEVHRQLLELLRVQRVEVIDLYVLGERRAAALLRFVIHAGDGEGTIDQQCLDVHAFREDGALMRQTVFFDVDEGRRELGL